MEEEANKKEFNKYLIDLAGSSVSQAAIKGILFYLSFMIWDFYAYPTVYPTLWTIRITVAVICVVLLSFHKHPFVQNYRRFFYLFCISLLLNSAVVIWSFRNSLDVTKDLAILAIALVFVMSGFRMLLVDALIVGGIFCFSFSILLLSRDASQDVWITCVLTLGTAYVVGAICANIAEHYLYKTFLAEKLLRQESNRADNLLLKTFPVDVANELKLNHNSAAKKFDNVTVMFCDIINFTEASRSISPEQLVETLNHTFSAFDRLTTNFGCEKIKTVGDAYMVVCGAPTPVPDHAKKIVSLALAIIEETKNLSLNDRPLKLRIGINSGPVVAGVIGQSRFAYDLWGGHGQYCKPDGKPGTPRRNPDHRVHQNAHRRPF
jgi:hypothetical protein